MPRNGSGVYSKPAGTTAIPNSTIESSKYNQLLDDIAADLNTARPIVAGGTGATTTQAAVDGLLNGTTTVLDTSLRIADPADRTKIARIDAGRITTETVRVMNAPDRDINVSGVDRGYLYGLTLSNNATDATNDIDIAAGEAADDSSLPWCMVLSSALTKRLDAAWAVGTGNGGLDTGSIANTTYHIWIIQRSDTGVVDALFSTSATSPTMPTNYDRKRRIGSVIRTAGAILGFRQFGDYFYLTAPPTFLNSTSAFAATLQNAQTPSGIVVKAIITSTMGANAASSATFQAGHATFGGTTLFNVHAVSASQTDSQSFEAFTNTAAQIYIAQSISLGTISFHSAQTDGWVDTRGQ